MTDSGQGLRRSAPNACAAVVLVTVLAILAGCGEVNENAVPTARRGRSVDSVFVARAPDGVTPTIRTSRNCAVDRIQDNPVPGGADVVIPRSLSLRLAGWAADTAAGELPNRVWIVLEGAAGVRYALADLRKPRPDVATALRKRALTYSGFELSAPAADLPPGRYRVGVVWHDSLGMVLCMTAGFVRVENAE